MKKIVILTVFGSGRNWKLAGEVTIWVAENTPDAEIWWYGFHDDRARVTFASNEDATAFKLRFPEWT